MTTHTPDHPTRRVVLRPAADVRDDVPDPPTTTPPGDPVAELAFSVRCPSCRAEPGEPCTTRLLRGYHLARADRGVKRDRRARYGAGKSAS